MEFTPFSLTNKEHAWLERVAVEYARKHITDYNESDYASVEFAFDTPKHEIFSVLYFKTVHEDMSDLVVALFVNKDTGKVDHIVDSTEDDLSDSEDGEYLKRRYMKWIAKQGMGKDLEGLLDL